MRLTCVGSGSKGNCYLLEENDQILILDAGMPIKDIKRCLGFDISNVVGCCITHAHNDHAKSVKDVRLMGLPVFAPYMGEKRKQSVQFGGYRITSFEVPHDGVPCVGFYITHGGHRMIYCTDMEFIPVNFKRQRLTDMIIECNHCDDLMSEDEIKYSHSVLGHASLEVTKGIVKANKTSALSSIILCHLSDSWADEDRMLSEIEKVAGKSVAVWVAHGGTEYILNSVPF